MLISNTINKAKMSRCKNKIVKTTQFNHKKPPVMTLIKNLAKSRMILIIKWRNSKKMIWKKMWARIIYWLWQKSRPSRILQIQHPWKPHHPLRNMWISPFCKNLFQHCKLIWNSRKIETLNSKMRQIQMPICMFSRKRLSEIFIRKKTQCQKLKAPHSNVVLSII